MSERQARGSAGNSQKELLRQALGVLTSLSEHIVDLGERFSAAGHELALVGGPVRDAFMGRASSDLDFTTSASPTETEKILNQWGTTWDIGREFGTIGARRGEVVVEVTTYRTEEYDVDSRKPHVGFGKTLDGDLSRRDFRVNSMAVRLPNLEFVDPFDGLSDLANRVLRTPGSAEQSFSDDPLRMLRAVRFAAQLDFKIAPEVRTAMTEMGERLKIVSPERIRTELEKLILAPRPIVGLRALVDTGLAEYVLPELPALKLEIDEHHRHKDVYEHSLTVLQQAIDLETGPDGPVPGPDLVLRLAALLHDIGKPPTRRFEPGGGVSFHHHEVVGAKMTAKRLRALRFDNQTIKKVSRLVELHLRFHGYSDGAWTDSAVRRYVNDAGDLLERLHRLTRSDSTTRNKRKAARLAAAYDDLESRIAALQEQEELAAIRPDLNGQEIMAVLGVGEGPVVGQAYKFLLDLRMEEGPLGREVASERLKQWWEERSDSSQ